jgi:hypothetical protein
MLYWLLVGQLWWGLARLVIALRGCDCQVGWGPRAGLHMGYRYSAQAQWIWGSKPLYSRIQPRLGHATQGLAV